jgi:aromatic ring-cleaving dioxygenase
MIQVDGNINDQGISILIHSEDSHIYLDPKMVEILHLLRRKIGKPWLVQLVVGTKSKINEMV